MFGIIYSDMNTKTFIKISELQTRIITYLEMENLLTIKRLAVQRELEILKETKEEDEI